MAAGNLLEKLGGQDVWVRRAWAVGLVAVGVVTLMAIKSVAARRLSRFAAKTVSRADDVLAEMLARTSLLFPLGISIFVVLAAVPLAPQLERLARGLGFVLCLLQTGIWGSIALRGVIEHRFGSGSAGQTDAARAGVARMAGFGARILMWSVLALVALAIWVSMSAPWSPVSVSAGWRWNSQRRTFSGIFSHRFRSSWTSRSSPVISSSLETSWGPSSRSESRQRGSEA